MIKIEFKQLLANKYKNRQNECDVFRNAWVGCSSHFTGTIKKPCILRDIGLF